MGKPRRGRRRAQIPGRLSADMQNRIRRRLTDRHAIMLRRYVRRAGASSGDSLVLKDLARSIAELELALERLARNEYGFCLGCGRYLGQRLLLRTPLADRCGRCKMRLTSSTD
jgi:hypothetical protein